MGKPSYALAPALKPTVKPESGTDGLADPKNHVMTIVAYAAKILAVNTTPIPDPPAAASAPAAFYDASAVGDSIGQLLHQLMVSMRRDIEQGMAAHGLTAAQWLPLWKLKLGKASNAQELTCELGVDGGAMTRLLDRLEAKGLVERSRSSTDRRVVHLTLTEAGEAAIVHVPAVLAEVNNKHLRGFSVEEWTALKKMLLRMLANSAAAEVGAPSRDSST